MKKIALLTISLLVLIIGVACASAVDINGSIDDSIQTVDHQCDVEEIDCSSPDINQDDMVDIAIADSLDDVNEIDRPSFDMGHDASIADSLDDVKEMDDVAPDDVKDIDASNLKPATDLGNVTNSTVTTENSTQGTMTQNQNAPNIIDDTPKEVDTSAQKQNSLRPDIAKYNKYFLKNQYKTMPNGKKFSEMDLLLEISKHYSFEDTVIIAMHVLRDNGVRVTFNGLEAMLKQMQDGTVYTYGNQNNASYYKDEMQKIHESHNALNVNAAKYSDIYKNMSAKKASDRIKSYVFYDLILRVYKDTFDKEQTVLIATYAFRHSGLNVTVASVEDSFNQMIQGTLSIGNDHSPSFYGKIINILNVARDRGFGQDIIDLLYIDFINLRSICYE